MHHSRSIVKVGSGRFTVQKPLSSLFLSLKFRLKIVTLKNPRETECFSVSRYSLHVFEP